MMSKMMKKAAIAFAAATMAISGTACVASAEPCNKQAYVIAASGLNVRTEPSTDGEIVTALPYSAGVTIIDTEYTNGWAKIKYNGEENYVSSNYLSEKKPAPIKNSSKKSSSKTDDHGFKSSSNVATKKTYKVKVASGTYLALRNDKTSADSAIIGQLYNGDKVKVLNGKGKFWKVKSKKDGKVGYVNSNYLV